MLEMKERVNMDTISEERLDKRAIKNDKNMVVNKNNVSLLTRYLLFLIVSNKAHQYDFSKLSWNYLNHYLNRIRSQLTYFLTQFI